MQTAEFSLKATCKVKKVKNETSSILLLRNKHPCKVILVANTGTSACIQQNIFNSYTLKQSCFPYI